MTRSCSVLQYHSHDFINSNLYTFWVSNYLIHNVYQTIWRINVLNFRIDISILLAPSLWIAWETPRDQEHLPMLIYMGKTNKYIILCIIIEWKCLLLELHLCTHSWSWHTNKIYLYWNYLSLDLRVSNSELCWSSFVHNSANNYFVTH